MKPKTLLEGDIGPCIGYTAYTRLNNGLKSLDIGIWIDSKPPWKQMKRRRRRRRHDVPFAADNTAAKTITSVGTFMCITVRSAHNHLVFLGLTLNTCSKTFIRAGRIN